MSTRTVKSLACTATSLIVGLLFLTEFHFDEFASGFSRMFGDLGDSRLTAYLVEHLFQVVRGNENFFNPSFFYPVKNVAGYSDVFLIEALPYSILRFAGLHPLSAHQASIIFFNFLNFFTCYAFFSGRLKIRWFISLFCSLFFAFNLPKFYYSNHPQLSLLFLLPLIVWLVMSALFPVGAKRPRLYLSLAALLLNIELLSSFYLAWFFILVSGIYIFWCLVRRSSREVLLPIVRAEKANLFFALCVFLVSLVPFARTYLPVLRIAGKRSYGEVSFYLPHLSSYFWMDKSNWVWGRVFENLRFDFGDYELRSSFGLVCMMFGVFIFVRTLQKVSTRTKDSNPFVLNVGLTTLTIVLLTFNFGHGVSLWWFIYKFVPGGGAVRAVARISVVLALPLAVAFGVELERIYRDRSVPVSFRTGLIPILGVFALLEQMAGGYTFDKAADIEKLNAVVAQVPSDCEVVYAAYKRGGPEFIPQVDAMFASILTNKVTVNGYSGQTPQGWDLWNVYADGYEQKVRDWLLSKDVHGKKLCGIVEP